MTLIIGANLNHYTIIVLQQIQEHHGGILFWVNGSIEIMIIK